MGQSGGMVAPPEIPEQGRDLEALEIEWRARHNLGEHMEIQVVGIGRNGGNLNLDGLAAAGVTKGGLCVLHEGPDGRIWGMEIPMSTLRVVELRPDPGLIGHDHVTLPLTFSHA